MAAELTQGDDEAAAADWLHRTEEAACAERVCASLVLENTQDHTTWLFAWLSQVKRRAGLSPFPASFERGCG